MLHVSGQPLRSHVFSVEPTALAVVLSEQIQPGLSGQVLALAVDLFVFAKANALATNINATIPIPIFFFMILILNVLKLLYLVHLYF